MQFQIGLHKSKNFLQVYYEQVLGPECSCSLSGCEFDYQTNTYRLQVSEMCLAEERVE